MDENDLLQRGLLDDDLLVGSVLVEPGPMTPSDLLEVNEPDLPEGLPRIVVNGRQTRDIVGEAWAALYSSPFWDRLYIFDGQLVLLWDDMSIRLVDLPLMTAILNRVADWVTEKGEDFWDAKLS